MVEESLKRKTLIGLLWSGVERFSVQGVQFLVMLVIARILDPKDYGLVGMLVIFLAVAQSLIDSGFSQALIRKQDRTDTDNSTVFFFNIAVSIGLYILLYTVAPFVAAFYDESQLSELMRVLCIVIIINSFSVVQRALFTAALDFRTQAKASFASAVVSGAIGIYLAVKGFGVWTLVWQQICGSILSTVLLWLFSSWRPTFQYSWESFKRMFSFGSKLLASGLIDTIYNNSYMIVIGKIFNAASLGQYSRADQFVRLPSQNILGIIFSVVYPVLCSIQNDEDRLRNAYRMILRSSAFVVFPMLCGLAALSRPLVVLLIGDKWSVAAALILPLCFGTMWYPIHALNLSLLQVKGRSDLFLRLEIIKKSIGVAILVLSVPFGLMFMCYATIATSLICLSINAYYTGKFIQVGFLLQMRDLMPILLTSLIMFSIVYGITFVVNNEVYQLMLGLLIGSAFFLSVVYTFKFEELSYIKSMMQNNGRK